jgi:enoyl-CoA hydratase/carnithine racemase
MSKYEQILYGVKDRVATITLHRPERMNAWTGVMEQELRDAMQKASADEEVRAIVLTGEGRAFCAGADMEGLGDRSRDPKLAAKVHEYKKTDDNFDQRYSYLLAVPKPIIAGINGGVAGIGLVLTLYCDIRYMTEGAKLSASFARRGLVAEYGSSWMLPRLIGLMNTLDVMLSGRTMTAEEAAAIGLVKLLPAAGFRDAVHGIAKDFAELSSPRSMAIMKRQIYQAYFQTLAEATQFATAELIQCYGTEDLKEGIAHYNEKRKPNFTGR